MKFSFAVSALLLAVVASAQLPPPVFTNCATRPTVLNVTSVTFNPIPPCIGKEACITLTGALSHPITSGAKLNIIGKYLNRIIYSDAHDLCTLLANSGTPCPIPTSVTQVKVCFPIKSTVPYGIPYIFQFSATNGDGPVVFCQTSTFTFQHC
ncbi:hypothetical protein BX616_008810 [Lobosporangium transversale]|uniref:Phosphatidylglycerol/phosphatidylinositol transfer protein n=1 Tax=Lobosporangium transversale TaxID=64571 RepID=A0A1Y2G991_9FUNG|nr:hypothetical protein BCR41DRAFT_365348 [Lobosporangium transversale]KAF9914179.1 hypothetical protein BX616_008810 [Lobosporangium transversale]ORY94333.1 hypothetical protein BCR41DRAFT_365348 [Lobosporangium transversale]|eukprot:XP_021875275.1 hypothetical protein BCR41DRAFT_365348 [Lobosporangium transversale]